MVETDVTMGLKMDGDLGLILPVMSDKVSRWTVLKPPKCGFTKSGRRVSLRACLRCILTAPRAGPNGA